MNHWENVLERQVDLWKWWGTPQGQTFGRGFATSYMAKNPTAPDVGIMGQLTTVERARLLMAEPVYVNEEVNEVWRAATPGFAPEPLVPSDLFTANGFVWLPEPLSMMGAGGEETSWRAFLWSPIREPETRGREGILLSLYSWTKDDDPLLAAQDPNYKDRDELLLLHTTPWWFNQDYPWDGTWKEGWSGTYDPDAASNSIISTIKPVQCFFRLAQQTLTERSNYEPGRPTRRRIQKVKEDFKPYVTVIRLRRPRYVSKEAGGSIEYSHRWLVGAHWRNHWYPSLGIHRQKYILPYVKDPKDKPLKVRELRAFEFVK